MKVSQAIDERISCRSFSSKPVSFKLVKRILEEAGKAPSGGNLQPWHLFAITGDKKNDQSRVVTPFDAFIKNKADAIVMGRSLTKNDIKKNIQNLINHIY